MLCVMLAHRRGDKPVVLCARWVVNRLLGRKPNMRKSFRETVKTTRDKTRAGHGLLDPRKHPIPSP